MTKPRSRPKVDIEHRNPVAVALAKSRMAKVLRDQQIEVLLAVDGEESTSMLAAIGWQLGAGAQVAVNVYDMQAPAVRRLHGALRTVHQLCLAGYRWDAAHALAIDAALAESHQVLLAHPVHGQAAIPAANHFATLIKAHQVQPDTIVGAELYRTLQPSEIAA